MKDTMIAAVAAAEQALQALANARQQYATAVADVRRARYTEGSVVSHERGMRCMDDVDNGIGMERFETLACSRARTLGLGPLFDARVEGNYQQTDAEWVSRFTAQLEQKL